MKIELAVDESDIGQVKVGQVVSFTADAFADRQFKGTVEQVRLAATTTNNVVTYPVVVTVDNSDGTLLPGLTVNAEIEVSKRDKVLKVSNAALRYKPAEGAAATPAPAAQGAQRAGGSGITDDLARTVAAMQVNPQQQAAFDAAVAAVRERQASRQAQAAQGGNRMFGGGRGGPPGTSMGGSGLGDMQAQIRQRMSERFQQDFAAFRASLDNAQMQRWDAALGALLNAKRASIYRLVDGRPELLMVRIGASDGTATEVSGGGLKQGDEIVTGERARE